MQSRNSLNTNLGLVAFTLSSLTIFSVDMKVAVAFVVFGVLLAYAQAAVYCKYRVPCASEGKVCSHWCSVNNFVFICFDLMFV